jgi:hypothetical protein
MPAYRSESEAEVRTAVIERLRKIRPAARIMQEVNQVAGGGCRFDVLAVDRAEIIAVEIKSAKDKLDRLPAQVKAMRSVAHYTIAALHERFLLPAREGQRETVQNEPMEVEGLTTWIYPEKVQRADKYQTWTWHEPRVEPCKTLPPDALYLLWNAELAALCERAGVSAGRRPSITTMCNALRWGATGRQITLGVCAALRARPMLEGDDPMLEAAPAPDHDAEDGG